MKNFYFSHKTIKMVINLIFDIESMIFSVSGNSQFSDWKLSRRLIGITTDSNCCIFLYLCFLLFSVWMQSNFLFQRNSKRLTSYRCVKTGGRLLSKVLGSFKAVLVKFVFYDSPEYSKSPGIQKLTHYPMNQWNLSFLEWVHYYECLIKCRLAFFTLKPVIDYLIHFLNWLPLFSSDLFHPTVL